jgi:hypothetical protein
MISSEVERTLVKSPPELWTELSNPDALARHLGEFGDIRITRVEPEHAVEWEAQGTAGTVRIKPSGWGTKVTLTATREIVVPQVPVEAAPASEPPVAAEAPEVPVEAASASEPSPVPELSPSSTGHAMVEPVQAEQHAAVEPSRGFFSRLFGGRRRRKIVDEPREVVPAASEPPHAQTEAVVTGAPAENESETLPDRMADISAELKAAEEIAAEEVTAVLTSVLDRLGAAHHRPFSRA